MRRGGLFLAIGGLIVILFIGISIFTPENVATPPPPPTHDEIVTLSEPVAYCPEAQADLPHGRVQLLVDSSGSMFGVRPSVLNAVGWIEQGISRLRDSAVAIDELRVAQFDRTKGILPSASINAFGGDYHPSGETTLHEAVRASHDYDLTFILTDGVAAAGAGSGDCAGGVDAACVARALRDAVHVEQTTAVAPQPGLWLIPLWGRHAGAFFTEKPTATANFDSASSLRKVHDELSQNVTISNARADRDGKLMFDYIGPRGLLLIVIAHSDDLGRRAIAALRERMEENDVASASSIREASARPLSAFPAIELYPGYLPPVTWSTLSEPGEKKMTGTIEASLIGDHRIALDCDRTRRNEGEFSLTSKRQLKATRCVDIYQLPAFEFAFVGRTTRDQTAISSFISDYQRTIAADGGEQFLLTLQCGEGQDRPCATDPVTMTWMAQSRYDRSLGADPEKASGAEAILRSIATKDLVTQPHRIYGLDSLVSIFFEEVHADRRRILLSDLELCHGKTEGQ